MPEHGSELAQGAAGGAPDAVAGHGVGAVAQPPAIALFLDRLDGSVGRKWRTGTVRISRHLALVSDQAWLVLGDGQHRHHHEARDPDVDGLEYAQGGDAGRLGVESDLFVGLAQGRAFGETCRPPRALRPGAPPGRRGRGRRRDGP